MRHRLTLPLSLVMGLALLPGFGAAEIVEPAPTPEMEEAEDGAGLMGRGAELFFRGLRDEMAPAIEGLEDWARDVGPGMKSFMEEMGPAFRDLMGDIKDFSQYHKPEVLPNGDIILRKRQPGEEPEAEAKTESGPIDL
ncbi:hypothetical protein [Pseudooceanicola nanhaiensis]|uniref:hypothetical protein n=1 Tax=Pseudooceanicola nanhaiensis TaxID=375761 RepID=UPI001CD56E56|nr:hypothetical protein [Pseudooceanicola nanhaiensis]MCA0919216.1 hypothetical protein [Pseudooceanicola nanhaiensis]